MTRPFIIGIELRALLSSKIVVPAVLEEVSHTRDELHGLGALQLFRHRPPGRAECKAYVDCGGANRRHYCDRLVDDLVARLRRDQP